MDVVIPFVDCSKKDWSRKLLDQKYFYLAPYIQPYESVRYGYSHKVDYTYYYDYGTLKYVLRGIDKFMSNVRNIFLVVSDLEQVPNYIDQTKIKVVLHKDFIPSEFLPIFSSSVIEVFIHRIPGLDEEFVYMHDDMIPISPVSYDELFIDGKPCINFNTDSFESLSPYNKKIYSLSYFVAMDTLQTFNKRFSNITSSISYPDHGPMPLLKSICDRFSTSKIYRLRLAPYKKTKYRTSNNINICYWCELIYLLNEYVQSDIKTSNISISDVNNLDLSNLSKDYRYLCVNNLKSDTLTISEVKEIVNNKLNEILPNKCIYER